MDLVLWLALFVAGTAFVFGLISLLPPSGGNNHHEAPSGHGHAAHH
jgi:hypothetical protein